MDNNNNRSWNILNWNVRGLILLTNAMLSELKLKSIIVLSFVFKRLRKITLILLQLERWPQNGLISFLLFPWRELQEGSLWLGMIPSSKATSFFLLNLLSMFSSPLSIMGTFGN
jgi:hypothetical protein